MSGSDSSPLSSPPSSEDESVLQQLDKQTKLNFKPRKRSATPEELEVPVKKRAPSPPHEYVLADNPDIAFIVMFRSRFADAFPKSLAHFGPQDVEQGVVDPVPGENIESLLCALIGMVLNRKKYVERAHYYRALEEAIQTNSPQWPDSWEGRSPLFGGQTFPSMSATERLDIVKTLVLWALSSSEAVQSIVKESYKQVRHDDDLNQPLSVQPWGTDSERRRYWLIEGLDDTHFRLYRESAARISSNTWWSVAGTIEELREIGEKLGQEGGQAARRLSERVMAAIPRFEATEEKRRKREYRQAKKAQFTRPEPGFSLYEGRTRGKKMKYTYSDDEADTSDATSTRKSLRQSGTGTPREQEGPTITASGRQVRPRFGAMAAERTDQPSTDTRSYGDPDDTDGDISSRPRRSALKADPNNENENKEHIAGYNSLDEMEDEEEAASSGADEYGADEGEDEQPSDDAFNDGESVHDDDSMMGSPEHTQDSLVVRLKYGKAEPRRYDAAEALPIPHSQSHSNRNGEIEALSHSQRVESKPEPSILDSSGLESLESPSKVTTETGNSPQGAQAETPNLPDLNHRADFAPASIVSSTDTTSINNLPNGGYQSHVASEPAKDSISLPIAAQTAPWNAHVEGIPSHINPSTQSPNPKEVT